MGKMMYIKRGELHELIGATIRLLLSSIYTRNEGEGYKHNMG